MATTKLSVPASAAAAGVSAQENEKLPRVSIAPLAAPGIDRRNTEDLTLRLGDEWQNECPEDQHLDLQTWWIFLRQNAKRIDIEVKFGKSFLNTSFWFFFGVKNQVFKRCNHETGYLFHHLANGTFTANSEERFGTSNDISCH